jgi:alkaline phosphatase D
VSQKLELMGGGEGSVFSHGVASGDAREDGAVIWTRISGQTTECFVEWKVFDLSTAKLVSGGTASTSTDRDFTVKVLVEHLEPGHFYTYQFEHEDAQSARGRFKTLQKSPSLVRAGFVCCAKYNAGYFNAYRGLSKEDVDFVVHLGDYIYEAANVPPASQTPGANIGRDFFPAHECRTLYDYRQRYAQYRSDPDVQRLHAAHIMYATIDDHEIADNAWSGGADEHREAEHGPWSVRLNAALQAWEEWMPVWRGRQRSESPIYTSWDVGDLVTFALLETRTARSNPRNDCGTPTELGKTQFEWLTSLVASCGSAWLFVCSPSMMSPILASDLDELAKDALETLKLIEGSGTDPFHDLWDTYFVEREKIVDLLSRGDREAVVVSGDVHISVESKLRGAGRVVPEWTIPSVTSQNLDDKKGWKRRTNSLESESHVLQSHPDWSYCNFDDHGYAVVEISLKEARCEWSFVEGVLTESNEMVVGHRASQRRS